MYRHRVEHSDDEGYEGALWCILGCASLLFNMRRFFSYVYFITLIKDITFASAFYCPSSLIIRGPERGLGWCCHRPLSSLWVREGTKTGGGDFSSQDRRGKPLFFFFKSSSIRGCSLEKIDKKFWFRSGLKEKSGWDSTCIVREARSNLGRAVKTNTWRKEPASRQHTWDAFSCLITTNVKRRYGKKPILDSDLI